VGRQCCVCPAIHQLKAKGKAAAETSPVESGDLPSPQLSEPCPCGLSGDALLLLAVKKAPEARHAAPSLISEGISIDSLSKSRLLTENISHKSQVTGL